MYGYSVHLIMEIASIDHRGLKTFVECNSTRGLKQDQVNRLRNIVTALVIAPDMASLHAPPGWRVHQLSGDRAGTWSISVTGNWRLTFVIEGGAIAHLDLEDYH